jgi:hypothetical protein
LWFSPDLRPRPLDEGADVAETLDHLDTSLLRHRLRRVALQHGVAQQALVCILLVTFFLVV